ncbi:MAG TPA: PH domain-containing protein [Stenomitos sp.]
MGIKEEVYFEGGPHVGELVFGLLLGLTVICLPLTAGAVVRALWLRYRITNRRITVTGGWLGRDRSDVVYSQVAKVVSVSRGIGLWGDMVITLKDGNKLELKAVPKFRDVAAYIEDKAGIGTKVAAAA